MKIKICGMRDAQNIGEAAKLNPDFLGFIFAEKSPRFADKILLPETVRNLPENIVKTGVFVNADIRRILETAKRFSLNAVQLHGSESPDVCNALRQNGLICLKAFGIAEESDLANTKRYEHCADYFLFDTKCESHGGSGQKFAWEFLQHYAGETPFLLSGGIGENDAENVCRFVHEKFAGIDLNSKFEDAPAMKNIKKLSSFLQKIRTKQNVL